MRKLRIALAAVFFVGITLLFVGIGQQWWGWMAKLQFLPSCLALNIAVIVGVLLVTLLFGRLYCSVICPLGVLQDIFNRINPKRKKRGFSVELKWLRYPILVITVLVMIVFGQGLIALIAPYSAYGRIVNAIYTSIIGSASLATILTGALTLIIIAVLAYRYGRVWCNAVCPVGTALSLVSRFSLFRPVIDNEKCKSCGVCARACKASCIDPKAHSIDMSRCVVCFDCEGSCKPGAIKYKFVGWPSKNSVGASNCSANAQKQQTKGSKQQLGDPSRRNFIATAAVVAGSTVAARSQEVVKGLDGGLADVVEKKSISRAVKLVPAGAQSEERFYDKCTACQLCVSNCPNHVLSASTDLDHFLQPQMNYDKGFCRPECTTCSELCPTGAILPVSTAEKLNTRIGLAYVSLDRCFAAQGKEACGNCQRHCPSGAIMMVRKPEYRFAIPVVAEEQCIGCGACEYLCPSRPISAITVSGRPVHSVKS